MSTVPRFLCLLLGVMPVCGQTSVPPAVSRPVLKALPLGGDDDILSQTSRPTVASATSTPTSPATLPAPAPPKPRPPSALPVIGTQVSSPLNAKPTGEDALRLQIFLDQAKFGPGIIDGKPGRFTDLAVRSWNEVQGHPPDDWSAVNAAARAAVPNPLAVTTVPEIATKWVDAELPTKRSLQAKKKRMSYRSFAEFIAERYHCDVPYLAELNGWTKVKNLKPHDSLMVPNVDPFLIEKLIGVKFSEEPLMSLRHVVVDTKNNQARIFEASPAALVVDESAPEGAASSPARANRGLIASFPITPGKPQFIKFGTWELRSMVELPNWRYDQQLLDTGKRSSDALNIPPGPNSPVGVIWNGLSKPGIGMHGTSDPETIGRARSAGCIRLANWDAVRLPTLIRPGATVEIR